MKPPVRVACHDCGKMVRPRWVKEWERPPGLTLLGFSVCPACHHPALHIQGEPEVVAAVAEDFQAAMGFGEFDARPTDCRTGKPLLDG